MSHDHLSQNPKKSWFLAIPLLLLAMGAGCVSQKEEAAVNTATNVSTNTSSNTSTPVTSTNTQTNSSTSSESTTPTKTEETPAVTFVYKNGTYAATGHYKSPAGNDALPVTLVVKDDVVVDATVTVGAESAASKKFQEMFIGGYKTLVVGKKLSDVSLTKVSGSSLTPKGFNDAVAQIKTQAAM